MADIVADFRSRLNELEHASGMNERAFATFLGLKLTTYRNVKTRGAQGPSLMTLTSLIAKLGTDQFIWLLTGKTPSSDQADYVPGVPPGHTVVRLPRGDTQPVSNIEADLLEQALTVLRGKGGAKTFANALTEDIKAFHKSVQMANQTSGSGHGKMSAG